jgi:uncharacterized protein YjbI with pentapeptide repeats
MLNTKMIGNKIADARKKINISQAELAQRLFISSQAVGKWERGESMPDIITFNRLAEIMGVDLNYFSENFQSGEVETNSKRTIDNDGDIEEKVQDVDDNSPSLERQVLTNFSGSNLPASDFAGVTARNGKFYGSALRGSDFSGADLTGSSFKASDVRETNFDSADLTDCNFYALDLSGASFHQSILVRTNFNMSALAGAKFSDVKLTDVKLTLTDIRKAVFENCIFDGVDFDKSDMRGMCLDGMTFIGVKFDNTALKDVTFNGATLKNVSFRAPHALTNKYYRTIKAIKFDGAMMDKLSYNTLKSMGADLDKVNII